jgi:hypothetical protein
MEVFMQKLASILTLLAFVAGLGTAAVAKPDKAKGASMNASAMGTTMSHSCSPGKKWVKGYAKKNGMKVKGYCR